jgi:hypothetical protein
VVLLEILVSPGNIPRGMPGVGQRMLQITTSFAAATNSRSGPVYGLNQLRSLWHLLIVAPLEER